MEENPHYKELLQRLNEFQVEYLIVGGYAVMKYTEPRYTKDLDVWVHNSAQNSVRVFPRNLHERQHRLPDRRCARSARYPDTHHRRSLRGRMAQPDEEYVSRCSDLFYFTQRSHF